MTLCCLLNTGTHLHLPIRAALEKLCERWMVACIIMHTETFYPEATAESDVYSGERSDYFKLTVAPYLSLWAWLLQVDVCRAEVGAALWGKPVKEEIKQQTDLCSLCYLYNNRHTQKYTNVLICSQVENIHSPSMKCNTSDSRWVRKI